jgi:membrane protein YdbS with pleckstrin-like domain
MKPVRTRAIEALFYGTIIILGGALLGVWSWAAHNGFTALVYAALVIVIVGTLVRVAMLMWRFDAWLFGVKPRR